jgi:hypothetical protein
MALVSLDRDERLLESTEALFVLFQDGDPGDSPIAEIYHRARIHRLSGSNLAWRLRNKLLKLPASEHSAAAAKFLQYMEGKRAGTPQERNPAHSPW